MLAEVFISCIELSISCMVFDYDFRFIGNTVVSATEFFAGFLVSTY